MNFTRLTKINCHFFYLILLLAPFTAHSPAAAKKEAPVQTVASHIFVVDTPQGPAQMPLDISRDWSQPQPRVIRAVVMFHGKGRDVDGYYRAVQRAAELAGGDAAATSILVAPQFLNQEDVRAHGLPASVLNWRQGSWESGAAAVEPFAVSAYSVIDTIVQHLADRTLFPNLKTIVLAGHSGGGQAVQRYAVVGQAERLAGPDIHLKYVVANPSSYLYFSNDRPLFKQKSFRFAEVSGNGCDNYDHWKYGPRELKVAYVQQSATVGWQALEDGFARKDVVYLLGTADVDPEEKDLDVSCAAELQGPNRFLRGQAYYTGLHGQHLEKWQQRLWFVPGVAHSAGKMFTSECGVDALFERSACSDH